MPALLEIVEASELPEEFKTIFQRKTDTDSFIASQLEGIAKVAKSDVIEEIGFLDYLDLSMGEYLRGFSAGLANRPSHEMHYSGINGFEAGLQFRKLIEEAKGIDDQAYYVLVAKIRYLKFIFGKVKGNAQVLNFLEQNAQVR